jgi:hypothetical protein
MELFMRLKRRTWKNLKKKLRRVLLTRKKSLSRLIRKPFLQQFYQR